MDIILSDLENHPMLVALLLIVSALVVYKLSSTGSATATIGGVTPASNPTPETITQTFNSYPVIQGSTGHIPVDMPVSVGGNINTNHLMSGGAPIPNVMGTYVNATGGIPAIAAAQGKSVAQLMSLNPFIKHPNLVTPNSLVRIA